MRQLELIADSNPNSHDAYVQFLSWAITPLLGFSEKEKELLNIDYYTKEIIKKTPKNVNAKGEQIKILWCVLSTLLRHKPKNDNEFAVARRDLSGKLIAMWSELLSLIDNKWDANSLECLPAPSESSMEYIFSDFNPDILEPEDRKKYIEYADRVKKYWEKDAEQKFCKVFCERKRDSVKNCLQDKNLEHQNNIKRRTTTLRRNSLAPNAGESVAEHLPVDRFVQAIKKVVKLMNLGHLIFDVKKRILAGGVAHMNISRKGVKI